MRLEACWGVVRKSRQNNDRAPHDKPLLGAASVSFCQGLKLGSGGLQESLFDFFLAGDAMAGPGHSLEALRIDLLPTRNTLTKTAFANTFERALHHLQSLTLAATLAEEKFLGVGVCGAIGDILGRF